jgi:hypothetical protein
MEPLDQMDRHRLEAIVRGLSTAGRSLRLYPPTSPIPRESVESARVALTGALAGRPVLAFCVGRAGLTFEGETLAAGGAGGSSIADDLRAHAVAEIAFLPGCSTEDLLGFLGGVMSEPEKMRSSGGLGAHLARAGIENVRVAAVDLVVVGEDDFVPDADAEAFLRELGGDVGKLNTWISAMARRESAVLSEGLADLADAAGPGGLTALVANLAAVFGLQDAAGRDALLGAAMDPGEAAGLLRATIGGIAETDLAQGLTGGLFGKNMLSLSSAVDRLDLGGRLDSVIAEVKEAIARGDYTETEAGFFDHMIDVYASNEPEIALVEADATYRQVAAAANVTAEETERARESVGGARVGTTASAVRTMLALLDQQTDHDLYCEAVDNLARMVPPLVEAGDVRLAARVVTELSVREARSQHPWPDFAQRLRDGVALATGKRSMTALVGAVAADETLLPAAQELLRNAGNAADGPLAEAAVALGENGIAALEALLGRRSIDLLASALATAPGSSIPALVARLARENDSRSTEAVRQLLSRPDEVSRKAAVAGLRAAGGSEAARLLAQLLGELDLDNKDFAFAREIIGALARIGDPVAVETLQQLTERKALIKRGHFADVQLLAKQALDLARRGGGGA